jgi:citrate lyase subunit beta/citryl-CoA lyase
MAPAQRPRRSCLTVPGSSERFLAKARELRCDEVILDLEDAVAPDAKAAARPSVIAALSSGGWGGQLRAVRVNDASTPWAYRDVIDVVEAAGASLDAVVLPKVTGTSHVTWLDHLLTQVEQAMGLEVGRIAVEAQVEDAAGLAAVDAIAASCARLEALIFGPADFMASLGMRSLTVGVPPEGYPGDAFHYAHMRILVAARHRGLQAIDGPYAKIGDAAGLAGAASSVAALGYDGKWVIHPGQIEAVNEAFTPAAGEYERAERILAAYRQAAEARRGAVTLDGEMIDEATRKLALAVATRGRAAGLAG